jgi:hypothetical protein
MPYGHGPAMPQVTAVDDQFGTHRFFGEVVQTVTREEAERSVPL